MYTAYVWQFCELQTLCDAVKRDSVDRDIDYVTGYTDSDASILEIVARLVSSIVEPQLEEDWEEWADIHELPSDFSVYAKEFLDRYYAWLETIPHDGHLLAATMPLDMQGYIALVFKNP